ncbi:MAG: DinB family protein [Bacteroidota bacterium]
MNTPKLERIYRRFQRHFHIWVESLHHYSEEEFNFQPDENSWSLGQVYYHLLVTSKGILNQYIPDCLTQLENLSEKKSTTGTYLFLLGKFPPIKAQYKGTPPPSSVNIEEIRQEFPTINKWMMQRMVELDHSEGSGKRHHFTLGYLSAYEWFQFVEMHFHHHLRQKKRIEEQFPKMNYSS